MKLTKENNSFKFQLRAFTETIKKLEKENIEVKKSSDVKSETLEKLRKEVSDLSKILNTDRFKSIKSMEGDLFKALSLNKSLQQELIQKDKENIVMQKDFEHLKEILEKINMDVNFSSGNQIETQKLIEKKIAEQEKIIEEMRKDLELKQEHLKLKDESIKEVSIQNDSLHDEVEYFKNMAKSSKNHADKAINDLEFYRNKMVEFQSLKSQN